MKYARWRMLTRVGSVLSLCTRHAMNAALKSGGIEIKTRGFVSRMPSSETGIEGSIAVNSL